ncbi:MAG: sigma 54-interacting transcriptional regulator [Myxococcota bacterium]
MIRPRGPAALAFRIVQSPAARLVDCVFEVEGPRMIGREPGAGGLVIEDKKMSSRHCTIDIGPLGELVYRDEKSKNGSFLDGVKTSAGRLPDGAVLRIGSTLLVATRRGPDGPVDDPAHDLVGASPAFRTVCAAAIAAAEHDDPLVLAGEPGVEVEALARLVHRRGRGADGGPFVAVDCAVLDAARAPSELFGPTGKVRAAHGGTLFLDEVGALDAASQAALLQVLEKKCIPGQNPKRPTPVDVRVVAALYPEVATAMTTGHFRTDVYARLATHMINVPPLRERREDILRLVRFHAGLTAGQPLFENEAAEQALLYAWPENRRELRQFVMRIAAKRRPLAQSDLPKTVLPGQTPLAPREPIVNNEALHRAVRGGS